MITMSVVGSSVAANSTSSNLLSGKQQEFLDRASVIRVYPTASATGMELQLMIGNRTTVDFQPIGAQNAFPKRDQDLFAEGVGAPGDRLTLKAKNTTGSAVTLDAIIDVIPIG